MDPKDKKDIVELMGEVVDAKVTPRLIKIEEKQKEHDQKLDKLTEQNKHIIEQVVQNSEDITITQENVQDVLLTEERIETKIDATIRRQDDSSIKMSQLNRRVLKLETKRA